MPFYSIAEIFTQKRKEANEASPVISRKLKDTHIQDENQSVKWNRDYITNFNKEVDDARNKSFQAEHERNNQFQEECMKALTGHPYRFPLATAQRIWSKAYEDGHANGYPSMAEKLDTYAEFASDVIKSLPENSA